MCIRDRQYAVEVVPLDQSQYKYETPKILRSIFSTDSCLQSDNGVSTSNTSYDCPPPQGLPDQAADEPPGREVEDLQQEGV